MFLAVRWTCVTAVSVSGERCQSKLSQWQFLTYGSRSLRSRKEKVFVETMSVRLCDQEYRLLNCLSGSHEIRLKICVQKLLSDGECREVRFNDSRTVLKGLNELPSLLAALLH